jgi:hypothetical protein
MESLWDEEQCCLYKLPQIPNGFWNKIERSFYELNFHRNWLEIVGTLEFDEIWLTSSLWQLIARKNKFSANEDKKLEFHLKMEFGLISQ